MGKKKIEGFWIQGPSKSTLQAASHRPTVTQTVRTNGYTTDCPNGYTTDRKWPHNGASKRLLKYTTDQQNGYTTYRPNGYVTGHPNGYTTDRPNGYTRSKRLRNGPSKRIHKGPSQRPATRLFRIPKKSKSKILTS